METGQYSRDKLCNTCRQSNRHMYTLKKGLISRGSVLCHPVGLALHLSAIDWASRYVLGLVVPGPSVRQTVVVVVVRGGGGSDSGGEGQGWWW